MPRRFTDQECEKIISLVINNIWDGWATNYVGEVAEDFKTSKATIRNIIYNRGAYHNPKRRALCNQKSCGGWAEINERKCQIHLGRDRNRRGR